MMKSKKGAIGLDTVKIVLLSLLILAVLVIAGYLVLSTLRTSAEDLSPAQAGSVTNETVNPSPAGTALSVYGLRNVACTAVHVHNATNQTITAGNYTLTSDCYLKNLTSEYEGLDWNITYTYTYDINDTNSLVANYMYGTQSWFSYVPTIFVLLAIVVIILVIGIVIIAVSRFNTGMSIGSKESGGPLESI